MFQLILAVHIFFCLTLIGLVLLQQGKGADMGATFGGGGRNTQFGVTSASSVFTRMTTGTAILFMITSVMLVKSYGEYVRSGGGVVQTTSSDLVDGSVMDVIPAESAEVADENPAAAVNTDETTDAPANADGATSSEAETEGVPAANSDTTEQSAPAENTEAEPKKAANE